MPKWRNWQTRTFEGRVRQLVGVRVPPSAPLANVSVVNKELSWTASQSCQNLVTPKSASKLSFSFSKAVSARVLMGYFSNRRKEIVETLFRKRLLKCPSVELRRRVS